MDDLPRDKEADASGESARTGDERRMVHRLIAYWRELSPNETLPSPDAMKEADLADIWPYRCILETTVSKNDPVFLSIGRELARCVDIELVGKRLSEASDGALIRHALAYAPEVVRKRVPVSRGGNFINGDGEKVLFRSIILPLSNDGKTVSALFSAANWTIATYS